MTSTPLKKITQKFQFHWPLCIHDWFPPCRHCPAVQRLRGVPDAAAAGEAGDQASEPSAGRDRAGGGVQGAGAEAPEGGVREHAEVDDLPVQQAGAGAHGLDAFTVSSVGRREC